MSAFDARTYLQTLSEAPGVYRMIGADEEVLYVGKAKNLKRRVASYFQRTASSPRIGMMVSQVQRVDTTVVRSEAEALILENNLIKSLRPKYNILFRDDKSYPYIKLTQDAFPRIAFFRGTVGRDARYFGPLPSVWAVRETIQLVQRAFLLRTCENSVFANRSRPCLLHQIHRCSAPCVGKVSKVDYDEDVRLTSLFLSGRHSEVIDRLSDQMNAAAEALAFEKAAQVRDQIKALSRVLHKQYADSARDEDIDIVVAVARDGAACVNHAMVRGGRHLGDHAHFPAAGQGSEADMLCAFLAQHFATQPPPGRVIVNVLPDDDAEAPIPGIALALARNERERAWADMALKNAEIALRVKLDAGARATHRVRALVEALELDVAPERIECFDISHTMGEATVASCVVWANGAMRNSEYRRYNIEGVTPGDDYAAMRQVLTRRYEKVVTGEGVRPDLVLIDGGKGQLGIAVEVMAELGLDLSLVGVAKGVERKMGAEELIRPGVLAGLVLGPEHPALHLIAEIRDEAHRFAIAGHRARREKKRLTSTLEDIPGIGPARRKRLLTTFGGLSGVRNATVEDLCRVEGISRKLAEQIQRQLN